MEETAATAPEARARARHCQWAHRIRGAQECAPCPPPRAARTQRGSSQPPLTCSPPRAGKFTGKELFTKDRSLFSLSDDKTSSAAASGAADDAGEAGAAGASADAATGVVAEENAALFLDEVELDDIEDDEEQPAAEGGAAAGATDAAAPAAAAAPASSS